MAQVNNTAQNDSLVGGLKYQVARQRDMKENYAQKCDKLEKQMVALFRLLVATPDGRTVVEPQLRAFVATHNVWAVCESSCFGILTHIAPYENKKGKTHLAHYTQNGNYLGTVSSLGDKPISYKGWFPIDDRWTINWGKLESLLDDCKEVKGFFEPPVAPVASTEEALDDE